MIFNWNKTERVDLGVDIYEAPSGERVEVPRNRAFDAGIAAAEEALRKMHEIDLAALRAEI
jgi:hypothetical protein